ncbi:MAG: alginate lyase family protein [Mangrovibacterium sp.]
MNNLLLISLITALFACGGKSEQRQALSVWNYDHMTGVKTSLQKGEPTYRLPYENLIRKAEKILPDRPTSVMDKPDDKVAVSADKNDFISVGKYCWPNPNAPDGKMPRELARTLGLGYSAYNIIHMLEICEMAAQINPSLYEVASSDGRCIGKAIDYIAQFPGKTVEDFAPYQQIADWDKSIRQICWILKWADKYDPSKKYGDIFKRNAGLLADDINNLLY